MMGKFLTIKLLLISFFLIPLNNNADEKLYFKGGVFINEIPQYRHELGFTFQDSKVLTYEKEGKFYLVFGIPYKSKIGENIYLLKNGNQNFPVQFIINEKVYATQRIKVAKKCLPKVINMLQNWPGARSCPSKVTYQSCPKVPPQSH